MGSYLDPSSPADAAIQTYILTRLGGKRRGSVVSANAIAAEILTAFPQCGITEDRLKGLISEAAMLLGLIPINDPAWRASSKAQDEPEFGYGFPAHRPDPSASYGFNPGPARTLPVRDARRAHLVKQARG
jgi:hypothetical protein